MSIDSRYILYAMMGIQMFIQKYLLQETAFRGKIPSMNRRGRRGLQRPGRPSDGIFP
jgi:hypothetical protein